jgi:two-component system NarL family sensor kinase
VSAQRRPSRQPLAPSRSTSRELRILKTIAEALNAAASVDDALQTTLEQVAALLGLHTGWIWLIDPQTGRFYSAVVQRLPPFLQEPVRMTGTPCWCLNRFEHGELTADNIDVMECSRLRAAVGKADRANTHGLRYHASLPLYFRDQPLGIMNVAAPAWRKLSARELDLLSTIASQVGVAIERARLAGETVQVARTEERTRLARDIHDTLAQRLTAIGLHLEAAMDQIPRSTAAFAAMRRALEQSRSGLDEARRSIVQLRAPLGQSWRETLDSTAHLFTAETGIRVHLRSADLPDLDAAVEGEVLGIVREALTNVRKHAEATDVELSIRAGKSGFEVQVADNGRGFNPRRRTSGFGLLGMRERAQAVGGRLRIASSPGHGTRIVLTMPKGASR